MSSSLTLNYRRFLVAKLYFAEFERKSNGQIFQKFGHTSYNDALDRFRYDAEQYEAFDIRILATAYNHSVDKCRGAEEAFKVMFPKNLWLEEKISGVTEIVQLDYSTRNELIQMIRKLNDKWKKECFNNENSTRSA